MRNKIRETRRVPRYARQRCSRSSAARWRLRAALRASKEDMLASGDDDAFCEPGKDF